MIATGTSGQPNQRRWLQWVVWPVLLASVMGASDSCTREPSPPPRAPGVVIQMPPIDGPLAPEGR